MRARTRSTRPRRAAFIAAARRPPPSIVTAAASIVDDPSNRRQLRPAGRVVWLRAGPRTLRERIDTGAGRRSDAVDETLLSRWATEREPLYREVADQVVDVDGRSVDDIVAAIQGDMPD